jgi:hypothetical protein
LEKSINASLENSPRCKFTAGFGVVDVPVVPVVAVDVICCSSPSMSYALVELHFTAPQDSGTSALSPLPGFSFDSVAASFSWALSPHAAADLCQTDAARPPIAYLIARHTLTRIRISTNIPKFLFVLA